MKKVLCLFLSLLFVIPLSSAEARIDIVPQKIIVESRERGGEVTILNLSNEESSYRITLKNLQQNIDGIYTDIKQPLNSQFDPEKIVRFSPKQFTLPPRGKQKIRITLRKPSDLEQGEYRFHLQALQHRRPQDLKLEENSKAVVLKMNTGISIPVIVRHGITSSGAQLGQPSFISANQTKSEKPELHMSISREGNASTVGLLQVLWQPTGENARRIGRITNLNIFTEIDKRNIKLPLSEMPVGSGKIYIRFVGEDGSIFDEISLDL